MVAVASWLSVSVTPEGRLPVSPITIVGAVGKPVVVTAKVPAVPTLNAVLFALVMAGAWFTVSVKDCEALGVMPLFAVIVNGYVPPDSAAGVPASVAVPSWLSTNETPEGRVPVSPMTIEAFVGKPVVVTAKVPAVPTLNAVLFALVMAGGWFTVSVKVWLASGGMPFAAVMVIG